MSKNKIYLHFQRNHLEWEFLCVVDGRRMFVIMKFMMMQCYNFPLCNCNFLSDIFSFQSSSLLFVKFCTQTSEVSKRRRKSKRERFINAMMGVIGCDIWRPFKKNLSPTFFSTLPTDNINNFKSKRMCSYFYCTPDVFNLFKRLLIDF